MASVHPDEELVKDPRPLPVHQPDEFKTGINVSIVWLVAIQSVALAYCWRTFSWPLFMVMIALSILTGWAGICVGFHRLMTHESFKTFPIIKYFYVFVGTLAGEGSIIDWVADHRRHHKFSDIPGKDPHSPKETFIWAHFLWLSRIFKKGERDALNQQYAPDLLSDWVLVLMSRMFLPLHLLLGAALFGIGYWIDGLQYGWEVLLWCTFVRMAVVLNATWLVNSAAHKWGYRNYNTDDDSRNNWFVALLTGGEGWHNNHHADPKSAVHGHRWWEIDLSYRLFIWPLEICGLVWDVKKVRVK